MPVDPSCRRGQQATPPPSPSGRAVAPAFGQPRCLCPQRGPSSASGMANAGAVVFIGYRLPLLLLGLWRVVALLTACRQPRAPSCGRGPRLTTRSGATTSPTLVVCAKVLAPDSHVGLLGRHQRRGLALIFDPRYQPPRLKIGAADSGESGWDIFCRLCRRWPGCVPCPAPAASASDAPPLLRRFCYLTYGLGGSTGLACQVLRLVSLWRNGSGCKCARANLTVRPGTVAPLAS